MSPTSIPITPQPEVATMTPQNLPTPPLPHDLGAKPEHISAAATLEQAGQAPRLLRNRSKSVANGTGFNQAKSGLYFDGRGAGGYFGSAIPLKAPSWEPTLEKAIKAIVSIKANHVRSFDTETSGGYSATGFIVDAARGLVLSNRHVVSPAPIVAQAVLTNYEEVDLRPIYRDPVHDFGFLQFDPSKVKFMDLVEISLSPERAKVGLEIRVVGNDAGEKLSILAGTLARMDRRAPDYGIGEYNDFNTFYLQAASGTSGGSSGSPVLDIEGHAVALHTGGASKASSSFYLPLDRVKRALKFIQDGLPVPRGTLQTEFEFLPFDEVRRLGLKSSIEEQARKAFPEENGMLVVKAVLPKGPADGILNPGDILISVNGAIATNFIHVFSVLDEIVGSEVTLTISRNKHVFTVTLTVQDLHSITPNRFVEVGGAVLNELSYQMAKTYSQPVGGVHVATSGHMFASASAWRKSIVISINNIPTPNLDAFIEAMKTLPDGARVPIRFYSLTKAYKEKVMIMHVDRHWHSFKVAVRNDKTGLWDFTLMPPPPRIHSYLPATASFPTLDPSLQLAEKIMPSMVAIDFHMPYLVDGMKNTQFCGAGVILSTNPPLILCDRDTVPISTGDIYITFADSIIIPGKLRYLHPTHNYTLISYDPTLLGDTPIKAITFSDKELMQGDAVNLLGITGDHTPVMKKTTVTNVGNVGTKECSPPRWRSMNVEGVKVDDPVSTQGGVLCDAQGHIQAFWLNYSSQNDKGKDISFMSGLPVSLVRPILANFIKGELPKLRGLDTEFWTMRIAAARTLGLNDEWVKKIEAKKSSRHTLLYVLNILDSSSPAAKMLKVGDVVLEMQGEIMTRMADLSIIDYLEEVHMKILRDNQELEITVPTIPLSGFETQRVIGWQGALIQNPYKAVLEQVQNIPTGVYVSCTLYGSPASTALRPGVWIVEVHGRPISDLDSFLEAVHIHEQELKNSSDDNQEKESGDGGYVRIKTVSRTDVTKVVAMKMDTHYWETWQLVTDETAVSGWKCIGA